MFRRASDAFDAADAPGAIALPRTAPGAYARSAAEKFD